MGYFDPLFAAISFRSFLRRLGLGPSEQPSIVSAVFPTAQVLRQWHDDEIRVWGVSTVVPSIALNSFGSCGLLSGSATPSASKPAARRRVHIHRIIAWAARIVDGTVPISAGFYLYTPNGAYLNQPTPNGGFGATPTLFIPGLVLGTQNYGAPEAIGISGQTTTQLPQSPFTSPIRIIETDYQAGLGAVPRACVLWETTDPPLVLLRDQVIGVQLSFSSAANLFIMFVSWFFSEHETEGA